MTTQTRIRASDTERERIAARVQQASAEGRLTLAETEQRLGDVYAATYVDELAGFVADLPAAPVPQRRFPPPLRVHAAVVALLGALLVVAWAASGAPFFWPVVPLFWLTMSLVGHAGLRYRRSVVQY
ncbi:DUF1707 domain-containing protein [Amycolatopsis acidiphila]|uniref:DUF1707 domain-containing protein n=1 Tax=Amycolatopsis acidiphila TaxID=715473 RepID=A0A557ZYI4_9PSEU|nr:DUF1707 domain-containing protein [Amycolatopsis acidiphila]TVT17063.1 DUF1707 domain-containing protein [Amycolatopsis acidiphila]UIJ60782.1 DUF1707 domain-containing protein [Amycolatopsis acidiphila]GHG90877.1 hypothetical protein GCM10017788_66670 [Amycolatopsis acidiphila]